VATTKAQRRRDERSARKLPIPRGSAAGLSEAATAEWKAWWSGGWASLWSEVEQHEARELIVLVNDFHQATEPKDRARLAPVLRAGRKRLGLDKPSPLPDEAAPADSTQPAKRKDPRA
jgi:hypothetical protein